MQPDEGTVKDLVLYRLGTSDENIRAARIFYDAGMYKDSNNRAYYSIFHSIAAVQSMDGKTYKRHKDAIGNFNKDYVKTEIFPREIGRRIAQSQRIRQKSDYDVFYIATKEKAEEQIKTATDLLELVKKYCEFREYGLKEK